MRKYNYPMGSVSSGTLRPQDLFEAFTTELQALNPKRYEKFVKDHAEAFAIESYDRMTDSESEELGYAVEALFDILSEFSGPYFYFGSHPGDGADYGFWFSEESFDEAVYDGYVIKCDELPERFIVQDNQEYFAVISDHGNITLYDLNGHEIWGIV
jgi:hypothetical protein